MKNVQISQTMMVSTVFLKGILLEMGKKKKEEEEGGGVSFHIYENYIRGSYLPLKIPWAL